jgi:hypothetical protein
VLRPPQSGRISLVAARRSCLRCCDARAPAGVWRRSIQARAVSRKRAGGHDLIKPALAGNPGELERTRGVIRHVCASVKAELNSPRKETVVQAITVRDRAADAAGLTLSDIPRPHAAENDVIVRVHAAGFTLVTIAGPPKVRPADGRAIFFVVEPDRLRLADLAERVRSGRLNPIIGAVRPLAEAPSAFAPDRRMPGKTIIRVTQGG